MVDQAQAYPVPRAALTEAELRALAYFAIGIGSEGSIGGRDVSNRLSFAGTLRNGVLDPVGNSGYSIGTLQTDLGQHPEAALRLVDAYQAWARTEHVDWLLTGVQRTQTANDLGRNGQTIEAQNGRPLDATVKSHLDSFLASDAGITFVHEQDVAQIGSLVRQGGGVDQLQGTNLYRSSSLADQAKLATIVLKLENQGGRGYYPRIIDGINNGTITTVQDARILVDGFMPNRSGPDRNGPDYIESGMDHALAGTEVFISLRNADPRSPLHQPWQTILGNPLVNPAQVGEDAANPNLGSEYAVIKCLFLQKKSAPALIEALDRGAAYGYNITSGRGQVRPQSTSLYASGDDFLVMDGSGVGKAYVGGAWSDVDRADLTRINHTDGSVDLRLDRNGAAGLLLHIDPNTPVLRPARDVPPTGNLDPLPLQQGAPRIPSPVLDDVRHQNGIDAGLPPHVNRSGALERNEPSAQANDDPLMTQAERAVRQLEQNRGRQYDDQSACMAASIACMAKAGGLSQIDHVLLSEARGTISQGENLFVIQGEPGDPAKRRTVMKAHDAIATPVEQSVAQLQRLNDGPQGQSPAQALEERAREVGTAPMRLG